MQVIYDNSGLVPKFWVSPRRFRNVEGGIGD